MKKILWFALMGAVGCFLAAIGDEKVLQLSLPPPPKPPPVPQIDVMFVLDVTESMQGEIDGVKKGIVNFATEIQSKAQDCQIGLLAYRDLLINEQPQLLLFKGKPFTKDLNDFRTQVGALYANGGGDIPESTLDAIVLAAQQPFRPGATKVMILITDAPPHIPDKTTQTVAEAARILRDKGINQLHLVVQDADLSTYRELQTGIGGQSFSLNDVANGKKDFADIMPAVGKQVAEATVKAMEGGAEFSKQSIWQLATAIGLWTAVLALGIALALVATQNVYLKRAPRIVDLLKATFGSVAAGFVAGMAGQTLFVQVASQSTPLIAVVLAWAALGLLVGLGMSLFVPNLKVVRGLLGGVIGGAVGAAGFWFASANFGEVPGRLAGAAILGLSIGAMVALVEAVFREAWLEIQYGPKEIRTISLGAEPISLGSNQGACTVYAKNAQPIAYRYWLKDNAIFCQDVSTNRTSTVAPGDRRQIGNLVATVCGSGGVAQQAQAAPATRQSKSGAFSLRLSNGWIVDLTSGAKLGAKDIPGLHSIPPGGPVGQVNPHPTDPNIQGLQNLSHLPWRVYLPNGDSIEVKPGKNVRLVPGTRVNFGSIQGEIQR